VQATDFLKVITILNFNRDAEACYSNLRQNNFLSKLYISALEILGDRSYFLKLFLI
jgi:hypothetical protein